MRSVECPSRVGPRGEWHAHPQVEHGCVGRRRDDGAERLWRRGGQRGGRGRRGRCGGARGGGGGGGGGAGGAGGAGGGGGGGGGGDADLTIMVDAERTPVMEELAQQFGEENGLTVEVQSIAAHVQSQFVPAAQAGEGPDIVMGAHDWIGNFVQNGAIDPIQLSPDQLQAFNPLAIEGVTFNGQVYGVPFAVENVVLFRNTDLAPEAPATIEDLVATGQAAVDGGQATEVLAPPAGGGGGPYHNDPLRAPGRRRAARAGGGPRAGGPAACGPCRWARSAPPTTSTRCSPPAVATSSGRTPTA